MILEKLKVVGVLWILIISSYLPALAGSNLPEKQSIVSVSLGAEFTSGSYGTDSTIRSLYLPLIVTWLPNDRLDMSVEIPFIYQSSSVVTTELYRGSQSTMAVPAARRGGAGGTSPLTESSLLSGESTSDVSGLGDIVLRLGVITLFEGDNVPQLRPSLYVKCPTASTEDGLGTGEYDFGTGLGASKWFGNLNLNGEGFYNWQGKVEGFGLKDYVSYNSSAGYLVTETIEPMLVVKGATAPSTYSGNLLEARARIFFSLSKTTSLDLYASRGIAESSPDYGGGMTIIYSY